MFAVFGIILLVAGGILAFAVDKSADGIDLVQIGYIMIAGGALSLVVALIQGAGWMTARNTQCHTERHVSNDGQHLVEDVQAK